MLETSFAWSHVFFGHSPAFGYEPCEDVGCLVPGAGVASSCGRLACPSCGCSGTNLATLQAVGSSAGRRTRWMALSPP